MFGIPLKAGAAMALILSIGLAQTPATGLTFEVASVKPSLLTPREALAAGKTIGTKIDGARVDIGLAPLTLLVEMAYNVKPYQLVGPDWMAAQRFDILAKLPDGATKAQVPEMLQALLAERFKLVVRRENNQQMVYALLVGKDGPNLTGAAPDAPTSDKPFPNGRAGRSLVAVQQSPDGPRTFSMLKGVMLLEAEKISMPDLASILMRYVDDTPVVDMTGLTGYYQIAMPVPGDTFGSGSRRGRGPDAPQNPTEASDPSSSIFASVQKLGLKLERRKAPVERIVVEHLEKFPTEN